MGRGQWVPCGAAGDSDREISNVVITITDNAAVVEGQTVIAVCNGKTFSSLIKNGIAKIYTSEVGTYTITAGDYSTMLVCPYFGQFSTDIYSGVLKITCTETEGNNKTCHVQSCDEEHNFTNDYNLTQTFDSSLGLTFMGIPTGRYLITVDDKYRFFKEIISIQSVNEKEVELKQWLYKDGDQCVHNTGGWTQCLVSGVTPLLNWKNNYHNINAQGSASQSMSFLSDRIKISQSCYSRPIFCYTGVAGDWHIRANVGTYASCGTALPIPIDISKYKNIHIDSSQTVSCSFRTGNANDSNTSLSAPTVTFSGAGNDLEFNLSSNNCYINIGKEVYYNGYSIPAQGFSSINYSFAASIAQIYLV